MAQNSLIDLVSGFFAPSKHSIGLQEVVPAQTQRKYGLTGVAKYLGESPVPETGVAKYLDNQEKFSVVTDEQTGVARYLSGIEQETVANDIVAKYLEDQEVLKAEQGESSVSRYIDEQEEQAQPEELEESSVSKYLEKRAQESVKEAEYTASIESSVSKYIDNVVPISSVDRYVAQQSSQPEVSSVSKYVVNKDVATLDATSVQRYVVEQSKQPELSTVSQYILNQEIANRTKVVSGVDKYLQGESILAKQAAAEVIVAKYLETVRMSLEKIALEQEKAAQAELEKETEKQEGLKFIEAEPTAVARYIARKHYIEVNSLAITNVARYVANKIVEESKKPKPTSVATFLVKKENIEKQNRPKTRVEAYVRENEASLQNEKPVITSGVSKYLEKQAVVTPGASGVAKYILNN